MKKKIFISSFAVVALTVAAIFFFGNSRSPKENELPRVKILRGDIIDKALAVGTIDLLQAIARVNRPYEEQNPDGGVREKPCGLIVDFVGVLGKLKKALRFDSKDVSGASKTWI